jgi:predicted nucleic acid-binding protein
MSLVLDGSAVLAWCFEDESASSIYEVILQVAAEGAVVPALWRLEVANALNTGIRRKRITAGKRDLLLSALADMDIVTDSETDRYAWSITLRLADQYGLTIYDASYLELALRRRLPLATLDVDLAKAAKQANVELVL